MSERRYVKVGTTVEVSYVNFIAGPGGILGYAGLSEGSYDSMKVWESNEDGSDGDWLEVQYDNEGRLYYY